MIFLPLLPFIALAELGIATGVYLAMLPCAIYGAVVPSRLQHVDGQRATEEYARENDLD